MPNFRNVRHRYLSDYNDPVLRGLRETNPEAYKEIFPNSLAPGISGAELTEMYRMMKWTAKMVMSKPPGTFLSHCADFLCSKKTYASIVEPHIADMQHEYFEALSRGRKNKAKWVRIRESIRLFYVLGIHRALKTIAGLFSHPKIPQ